jgi:hypothetical protein
MYIRTKIDKLKILKLQEKHFINQKLNIKKFNLI